MVYFVPLTGSLAATASTWAPRMVHSPSFSPSALTLACGRTVRAQSKEAEEGVCSSWLFSFSAQSATAETRLALGPPQCSDGLAPAKPLDLGADSL